MSPMMKKIVASAILTVAGFGVPSLLQEPANAWEELVADADAPVLEVNRGRSSVVSLDAPFATIAVADPEIASVTATSNKSFFVRGKAPGWTTVLVYDESGSVVELIQVNVVLGLDALRSDLNTLLPGENFEVLPVYDGVFISGDISTAGAAATAVQLAERHVPGGVANGLAVQQAQQVLLEVRFVEASRAVVREFGIGFNGNQPGDFAFGTNASPVSGAIPSMRLKRRASCVRWPVQILSPCQAIQPAFLPGASFPFRLARAMMLSPSSFASSALVLPLRRQFSVKI